MSFLTNFLIFFIGSYLIGSLSSAIIVCKLFGLTDPRETGSKNPGATNVMRIGGKKVAYLTFFGDFIKGVIPVFIANFIFHDPILICAAALGAFLGHLYPLYFGFKGGKGVATFAGILIAIHPLIVILFGIVWYVLMKLTKYVSVASIGASIVIIPIIYYKTNAIELLFLFIVLSLLISYRHLKNINNLLTGVEPKVKTKAEKLAAKKEQSDKSTEEDKSK